MAMVQFILQLMSLANTDNYPS